MQKVLVRKYGGRIQVLLQGIGCSISLDYLVMCQGSSVHLLQLPRGQMKRRDGNLWQRGGA